MNEIILYGHGGSKNHGCEAIVRSTIRLLDRDTLTVSKDVEGDEEYSLNNVTNLQRNKDTGEKAWIHFYAAVARRAFGSYKPLIGYEYKELADHEGDLMISVGGDNYCNGHPKRYMEANRLLSKKNKTVLWGCSITPELLKQKELVEDMNRYSLITARESITYKALIEAGVSSRVELFPDPAFTLMAESVQLPEGFEEGRTVGINLSPLVEKTSEEALAGIHCIIKYILAESDYKIALIPHVIWSKSDDVESLLPIYEKYRDTGRVIMVDQEKKLNCCQLKYIISKCKMLITARTHASIAAYSSCVPTMVLGYSVKSRGIAKDIFGNEEGYVVSMDKKAGRQEMLERFILLDRNCKKVKAHLESFMPAYISKAEEAANVLLEIIDNEK